MSQVIDKKVVEMNFDNSNFETNVKESLSTLDKLKKSLDLSDSAKTFESVSKAANNVSFDGITSGLETAKAHFSVFEEIAKGALRRIGEDAANLGIRMAKSLSVDRLRDGWTQYEEKTKSVQTIMNATGESIDTVDSYLEKLLWFTDETSYSFRDMTNNIGKFTSMGVGLEDSTSAMMGISNWAAISGAGINEASRAMYNLSQAMGIGSVRLMDWRSIENANMATKEFKEQVIDTAKAMGTLTDDSVNASNFSSTLAKGWFTSDVLLAVLKDYAKYSDLVYDRVQATGEACSEAMKYVSEYGDSFSGVAEKAFKAAQEAKTFNDAVDAVRDAVKSQWAQLFENVFGNYEEAKKTWTGLANSLWEVFAEPLSNVNDAFKEALASPSLEFGDWIEFRDQIQTQLGLSNEEFKTFESALKHTAEQNGVNVDAMIEKWGSFAASIQNEGWLTADILKKTLESTEGAGASAEEALAKVQEIVNGIWNGDYGNVDSGRREAIEEMGYNYDELQKLVDKGFGADLTVDDLTESMLQAAGAAGEAQVAIDKIREGIAEGKVELEGLDLQEFMSQMSGDALRNGFWNNLFNDENGAIVTYVRAFRKAFSGIFGDLESGSIRNALEKLYEWSVKLLDPERVERFKKRLENIFHAIHAGLTVVKGVWNIVKAIFNSTLGPVLKGLVDIIMSIVDGIGGLFSKLDGAVSSTDAFAKAVDWLNTVLEPVKNTIKAVSEGVVNFIDALFSGKSVFDSIVEAVDSVIDKLFGPTESPFKKNHFEIQFRLFVENLTKLKDSLVETFKHIGEVLSNAWETLSNTELGQWVSGIIQQIGDALSSAWQSVSDWFSGLFSSDESDFDFFSSFETAVEDFNTWLDGLELGTKLQNFSDTVMNFKDNVKNVFTSIGDFFKNNETVQSVISTIQTKFGELRDAVNTGNEAGGEEKEPFATRVLNGLKSALEWFINNLPSFDEVITYIGDILKSAAFVDLIILINQVKKIFSGGTGILKNVNKVLSGLGNALNGFAFKEIGQGVFYFSGAILAVAAALAILTLVDQNKLITAGAALGAVAMGFGVLAVGISKLMEASGAKTKNEAGLYKSLSGIMNSVTGFVNNVGTALSTSIKLGGYAKLIVALAAAIGVFAFAVYELAKVDPVKLATGVGAIIVLIGALAGAMKLLTAGTSSEFSISKSGLSSNKKGVGGAGAGIGFVGMAVALLLMVRVIKQIDDLNPEQLLTGIGAVAAILAELTLATRFAGNNSSSLKNGVGMLFMGLAMLLFVRAVSQLANFNFGQILQGVIGVGAILAELVFFSKKVQQVKVSSMFGILALGVSMLLFVEAIKKMGSMDFGSLVAGLGGLVIILGGIAGFIWVLSKITKDFENLGDILLGVAAVIAAVAIAVWALGDAMSKGVDPSSLGEAIGQLATGLVTGIVTALVNSASTIVQGILDMLTSVASFIPQIIDLAVDIVVKVLNGLTEHMPELATAIAGFVGALISSFAEAFQGVDLTSLIMAIDQLFVSVAALTVIGKFGSFGALIKGIGMLALVITAFGGIVAAFGALNMIDGFAEFMQGGVGILITIADGIGSFVGTLVGSALGSGAEAFSSSLPTIGENLGLFMEKAKPFIDECSKVDSSFLSSVGYITAAMLELTGANFVQTVMDGLSWLFGGTSTTGFIDQFGDLGEGLAAFAESIKDVDFTTVEGATNAAKIIGMLASIVPRTGGLIQMIVGEQDFEGIDEHFGNLGKGVAAFCTAIDGITAGEDTINKATTAAEAIAVLVDVIPNEGGLFQWITGTPDLTDAGDKFQNLGEGVSAFCSAIDGITTEQDIVNRATTAASAIAVLVDAIPNEGGLFQWITGTPDLTNAGDKFKNLGEGVTAFCTAIDGITTDQDTVNKASTAASAIAVLVDAVPNENGLFPWFTGTPDLSEAKSKFQNLGEGVAAFCTAVNSVTSGQDTVDKASTAAEALAALMAVAPKRGGLFQLITGETDFTDIDNDFLYLGKGVAAFCDAISGTTISEESVSAATSAAGVITAIMGASIITAEGGLWQALSGTVHLNKLGDNMATLGEGIASFMSNVGETTETEITNAKTAANGIIEIINLSWPTEGGLANFFSELWGGEVTWDDLKDDVTSMGQAIKGFCDEIGDLDTTSIESAKTAAGAIIELIGLDWPEEGGIAGFFTSLWNGGTSWDKLKTELPDMGTAIKGFVDATIGISTTASMNAGLAANAISSLMESVPATGDKLANIQAFINYIGSLGTAMSDFITNTANVEYTSVAKVVRSINSLIGVISNMAEVDFTTATSFSDSLTSLATTGISDFVTTFTDSEQTTIDSITTFVTNVSTALSAPDSFTTSGTNDATGFNTGLSDGLDSASAGSLAIKIASAMDKYYNFYSSGYHSMIGYNNGMVAMEQTLYTNAGLIAQGIIDSFNFTLTIQSPSKEFEWSAEMSILGFVNGMVKNAHLANDATSNVAKSSLDSMTDVISRYNFDDLDAAPSIRPVLDMSEVQNGMNSLNQLFDTDRIIGIGSLQMDRMSADITGATFGYDDTDVIAVINDLGTRVDNLGNAINNMKLYLNGRDLVGGIVMDMDNALGDLSGKRKSGVL